jgi:putative hemolysin
VLCLAGAIALGVRLTYGIEDPWRGVMASIAVAFVYSVVVGVTTTFVVRRAGRIALPLLRFFRPLELSMAPVASVIIAVNRMVNRFYPPRPEDDPGRVTELDVEHIIDQSEKDGSITEEHADLLRSVLEFTDTVAREVMVPRTRMVAIEIETPLREVVRLIVEKGHSRYPVYRGLIDQIEGVLYAKDLFRVLREQGGLSGGLGQLIRKPVFFAAETQKISDVLREMQSQRVHVAVVIDEFGGTSGMVTLEDIIEEIVGEIRDEHDYDEVPVKRVSADRYLAHADVSVYDLAELTGLVLPENAGAYDSVGGMIVDMVGRVPNRGESIDIGPHTLIVREADERHVTRVEVVRRDGAGRSGGRPPAG